MNDIQDILLDNPLNDQLFIGVHYHAFIKSTNFSLKFREMIWGICSFFLLSICCYKEGKAGFKINQLGKSKKKTQLLSNLHIIRNALALPCSQESLQEKFFNITNSHNCNSSLLIFWNTHILLHNTKRKNNSRSSNDNNNNNINNYNNYKLVQSK